MNLYYIVITTDNTLRVLQRIATVFSRNRVNIEKMNAFKNEENNITHINIAIYTESKPVDKLIKQLEKIIEVHECHLSTTYKTKLNP